MIPSLNKATLQNQHKVPRKFKSRSVATATKKSLNHARPEKKVEEPVLSKSHFGLLGLLIFALTYSLTSFIPFTPDVPVSFATVDILWVRLLISGSVSLLLIALLVHRQTNRITEQIDILCRHFIKYRRECESGDLDAPGNSERRTPMEQRLAILQELWTRFQSMQEELAQNVGELKFSKEQLEQTVADLQLAKEQERRLVELGHALAEFGHDIRNANGSISSFTTLLLKTLDKDQISPMEAVQAMTYIRRIQNSSANVSGLTTDILDFATGKMEVRPEVFELEEFQEELESQLGFIHDLPLHYRVPSGQVLFSLRLDGRKIIRVIVNLVKNAWEKFQDQPDTQDRNPAQVEVRFIPQNERNLIIQVVDNGCCIPDSVLPRLFESFQTEGKEKGTGLGLSISRQLIEAHGGSIQACNLPDNRGVAFEIFLPDCVIFTPQHSIRERRKTPAVSV